MEGKKRGIGRWGLELKLVMGIKLKKEKIIIQREVEKQIFVMVVYFPVKKFLFMFRREPKSN